MLQSTVPNVFHIMKVSYSHVLFSMIGFVILAMRISHVLTIFVQVKLLIFSEAVRNLSLQVSQTNPIYENKHQFEMLLCQV